MADSPGNDLELSFGELAVREKLVTIAQVREGLELQKQLAAEGGTTLPLAQILMDRGYLARDQVARLLKLQAGEAYGERLQIPGYEILTKIGHGAMGSVFKARQLSIDRAVAVKVLSPALAKDPDYLARFQREARACARLSHENIVGGIDVGTAGALHYFVMEYVEGEPLSSILSRRQRLPEAECLRIAAQVARALGHAHEQGIVHRDVKPENILIAPSGAAKLCDMGLAKRVKIDPTITMEGMAVGTPHYISPEQARGDENIDARADLYSLGAMLYRMSTGVPPFRGHDAVVIMTKHVTDEPAPAREQNPALSLPFSRLVHRLMQKDPARRPASAADLLREIEGLYAPEPKPEPPRVEAPKAEPPKLVRPAAARPRPAPPKPSPWAPVAAIGVILVGLVAIYFLWPRDGGASSRGRAAPSPSDDHARLQGEFAELRRACLTPTLPANIDIVDSFLRKAIARFDGTAHQEDWKTAHEEFRAEVNRRVADVWKLTEADLAPLIAGGRFSDAVGRIDAFPRHLNYFVPPPPGKPDAAVLTAAGAAARDARNAIQAKAGEHLEAKRREYADAVARRRWADAVAIAESFQSLNAEEADAKRADAVRRHLADLPGDPPTSAGLDALDAAITSYRERHGARADIAPVLDAATRDLLLKRQTALVESRARFGVYVKQTFYPAVREALRKRDIDAARALYRRVLFTEPNPDFTEALRERTLDLASLEKYLAGDREELNTIFVVGLEGAAATVREGGSPDVAWFYLPLFELCTIDYVADDLQAALPLLIEDGYAFSASGLPAPPTAAAVEREGGKVWVQFTVPKGSTSSKVRRDVCPIGDAPVLHVDDFVEALRRGNVNPELTAGFLVQTGILLLNAAESYRPRAKTLLAAGAVNVPARGEAYELWLDLLKDVATEAEEDEALRLCLRIAQDVKSSKAAVRTKAAEDCRRLLVAPLANSKVVKGRRSEVEQWLKDLGGAAPTTTTPRRLEDLFTVKPADLKGRWEWAYDFSDPRHAEDFVGRQGDSRPTSAKVVDGALLVEGMGAALWKGELAGAHELEAEMTPLDPRNIGLLTFASGAVPGGDGYLLVFQMNFAARMEPVDHYFFRMPIDAETGLLPPPLGDEIGRHTMKTGKRFKVGLTRNDAGEMTITVDDKKIITAADVKYAAGRPGFYVFGSRVRVESLRIRGKLDETWLKGELED